ncbi:S1C family serine protease [Noviherbaspirillum sp.]|uniref:S1C family serine protease n=1 Tax=Noviherbaspirillum sp. TaxID=1926288 RepID=UPI002D6EDC1D|nr:trypsin-like peptidase domain-containing protein [Noviherbaspirillum sp.]HZW20479.1 trypsin-like peptidase domain-containing protein [Noviherbaspirillum sp.]
MKRAPIYSRTARKQRSRGEPLSAPESRPQAAPSPAPTAPRPKRFVRSRAFLTRHERLLLMTVPVLLCVLLFLAYSSLAPIERRFTQRDIDAAVLHTLENNMLPSQEAKAYARIRPSVVRVVQEGEQGGAQKGLRGVGTGVVIIDKGVILTNLHVIGTDDKTRIKVHFANGHESDAIVLRRQPENDLAVIQAVSIPDDLVPATLRSTQGLAVGDKVVAVGYPFNIGPSASAGIVSGLKRTYVSPRDNEILRNLIQFDAAANPGNSGGPLITMSGEVVGIVTAILSPHEQGSFVGIGFAVPIEIAAAAAGDSPF